MTGLLKILEMDSSQFIKPIWYKLVKILAHLNHLQELVNQGILENIFKFIIIAYQKAPAHLCFYYFMKVLLLIVKKINCRLS